MRGDGRILDVGDDKAALVGYTVALVPPTALEGTRRTNILQIGSKDVGDAEVLTITLSAELLDGYTSPTYEDIKALVEWGAGSTTHCVEVDFLHGTMLSVDATFVKIVALHTVIAEQYTAPAHGNRWRVGASLAYGCRPAHLGAATTTVRPQSMPLLPGASVSAAVAPFAGAVEVLLSPGEATASLDGADTLDAVLYTLRVPAGSILRAPVVGGQHQFVLRNTGSRPITSVVFRQILVL